LSLFLSMRSVYLSHEYEGHVRENEHMLKTELFSTTADNTQVYTKIAKIVGQSTYIFPRLHNSLPLLLAELTRSEKVATRFKLISELTKCLLLGCLFNEEVYQTVKSTSRPKFLNIGLGLTSLVLSHL
jgi:hypothetical protein